MGVRNFIARWMNSAIAGRRASFWIDDEFEGLLKEHMPDRDVDVAAVLVLVNGFRKSDRQEATYKVSGITVTVSRDVDTP